MLSEKQKIAINLAKFKTDELVKKGYNPDRIIEILEKIEDTGKDYGGSILDWFWWFSEEQKYGIDFGNIDDIVSVQYRLKSDYTFYLKINKKGFYFTIGCQELTGIDKLESLLNGDIQELQLSEGISLKRKGKTIFSYYLGEKNRVSIRDARKIVELYKTLISHLTNQTN